MTTDFFEKPILNTPYDYPGRHWELDAGQPTGVIINTRRESAYYSPVPNAKGKGQPKATKGAKGGKANPTATASPSAGRARAREDQPDLYRAPGEDAQEYATTRMINAVRGHVERWRAIPNPNHWGVTPETARLLIHWRSIPDQGQRPFFCQVEAVETAIWLTEVAPKLGRAEIKAILDYLKAANADANPDLLRIALKLATGAGKTTVMAMLIAWQTVNAKRHPQSKMFSRGFLIVAPGITIRDRLRVLLPSGPDSYYRDKRILPDDMLPDMGHAIIVITNYHAFKLRERMEVAKGTREAIEGWRKHKLQTQETEGQMLARVMAPLMGAKNIVVLNDEAHHCYRPRVKDARGATEDDLSGDAKAEAKENNVSAALWITGIETVKKHLGVSIVYDLSATPFFLAGSGFQENALFPWTMSDFSLMDAIECGIVKLPRVPVLDNMIGEKEPLFRHLWEKIGPELSKKGRGRGPSGDPESLPLLLASAIQSLYGHYEKVFEAWDKRSMPTPPVFIVVCQNTAISELVYKHMAGYLRASADGGARVQPARCALFSNYDAHDEPLPRPRTILIDSYELESGDALSDGFRAAAQDEIKQFQAEIAQRTGNRIDTDKIDDATLLREVMNTVGQVGRLGEQIRCVISVGMLTEGWDARTVTHILGVRAFGTQLLCEQVVGRGLRRASYDVNADGLFDVEYADIYGIPFDFTAKPVPAEITPPRKTVRVHAVRPARDALEIQFPCVTGYRIELPRERIEVTFNEDSEYILSPDKTGPAENDNQGILGQPAKMTLKHLGKVRESTIVWQIATHLMQSKYRDAGEDPKVNLMPQLLRIVRQWFDGGYLKCVGKTYPAQLLHKQLADDVAELIAAAITLSQLGTKPVKAIIDPYNPRGLTGFVNFITSREELWQTDANKCHVNYVVYDSDWEEAFCKIVENHPAVIAYVKNQGLGFEVPYRLGAQRKIYRPDFIVQIDDGHPDPLNLVVEIKGFRYEDVKAKTNTMRAYWVPGVNHLRRFGRWDFVELRNKYEIGDDFERLIADIKLNGAPSTRAEGALHGEEVAES